LSTRPERERGKTREILFQRVRDRVKVRVELVHLVFTTTLSTETLERERGKPEGHETLSKGVAKGGMGWQW